MRVRKYLIDNYVFITKSVNDYTEPMRYQSLEISLILVHAPIIGEYSQLLTNVACTEPYWTSCVLSSSGEFLIRLQTEII